MTLSEAINAIFSYEGRLTAVVEAILNLVVYSGTQSNYANKNSELILCINNNDEWREEFLRYWMVERLITAEAEENKAM